MRDNRYMDHHQEKNSLFYRDFSTASQSYDPHQELFGQLQAGMEMLGMPSSSSSASSSKPHHLNPNPNPWQVDDSSLLCLLPGQDQQSSRRGLSLSLRDPERSSDPRDGFLLQNQRVFSSNPEMDERFFHQPQQPHELVRSQYLIPAQELLNEFCNLGAEGIGRQQQHRPLKRSGGGGGPEDHQQSSSWSQQNLSSMDLMQLQKRKDKLLSMLEEVDGRYRKYCDQMRAVVSSFEAVAGEGAANVYSTLASKAMSRHFRCLRDGIVAQIRETKKAMGDKETVAPGTTKSETPRLKLLDQSLRQHKAFQQAGMLEGHPWRPQRGLPDRAVSVLRAWLFEHFLHPYPSDIDKHILARQTGLSRSQVSNWFINARVRLWKPMVEEMYLEELKDPKDNATAGHEEDNNSTNPNNPDSLEADEQKPTFGQLPTDSDSLSSIINSSRHSSAAAAAASGRRDQSFGAAVVDLDFSSYNNFSSSSDGVSLTLGLQQQEEGAHGGGMTLSFAPASDQQSLLFSREHLDSGRPVQFSILDGDADQNLPYRSLVEAQLLHDLAG